MQVGDLFDYRGISVFRLSNVLKYPSRLFMHFGCFYGLDTFDLIFFGGDDPAADRQKFRRNPLDKSKPRRCHQHHQRLAPVSPSEPRPRRNKVCHHLRRGTTTNSYADCLLSKTSCGVNCLKSCASWNGPDEDGLKGKMERRGSSVDCVMRMSK